MEYKEYKKYVLDIEHSYEVRMNANKDKIEEVEKRAKKGDISQEEAKTQLQYLYSILDLLRSKRNRSIEKLKMRFANQDKIVKEGDIIWAGKKILRVEMIKLASFDYPMLKYFGTQLTIYGLPCKEQKKHPEGGIYQKDITSINGIPYKYEPFA